MEGADETLVNAGNSTEEDAMALDPPGLPSQDLTASVDPKDSESSLFSESAEDNANANDETAVAPENVDEPVPVGDETPPPPEGDGVSEDVVVANDGADESTVIEPEQPPNTDSKVMDPTADELPPPPEPESEDADDETVESSPANSEGQEASDEESAVVDDPPSPNDPDQLSNVTDVDAVAKDESSMDELPSPPEQPKGVDEPEVDEKEIEVTASPSASPTAATRAVQTSSPSSAKVYDPLPVQPVNIIVLTDVHSWVMGHGSHEPALDADYGDVLSFFQRYKDSLNGEDVYLVNNGDFIHGTILGDNPPNYLPGIIERMPFDLIGVGNHELTSVDSIAKLREPGGLFDEWGKKLITSNVQVKGDAAKLEPLGHNFVILKGRQSNILALGFLYNMKDSVVTVETVESTLDEEWFKSLFLADAGFDFDSILVLAHMDVQDDLVLLLLAKFRSFVGPNMVIQFITGHTHTRSYEHFDDYSSSFEAGAFLNTIGYISYDPKQPNSFKHEFINANRASIAQTLNMSVEQYQTDDGKELSEYIARTVEHDGGNVKLGCIPRQYRVVGALEEDDSLLGLHLSTVIPNGYFGRLGHTVTSTHGRGSGKGSTKSTEQHVFVQYLDPSVQYDLFSGTATMNDVYGVVPEDDNVVEIAHGLQGKTILDIIKGMDAGNFAVGAVATTNEDSDDVELVSPYGIKNEQLYRLHSVSLQVSAIQDIMLGLDVPAKFITHTGSGSFKHSAHQPQSLRALWVDVIKNEFSYDGDDCACLASNNCSNSKDYSAPITPSSPKGGVTTEPLPEIEGTEIEGIDAAPHKGSNSHISHKGSNSNKIPKAQNSHNSSKSNGSGSSGMAGLWLSLIAIAGVVAFVIRRKRRDADYVIPQRSGRSELDGIPDDLELHDTSAASAYGSTGADYASPAIPPHASFV